MNNHPDILIIGGGVIGLTTACRLADYGASVTIVDRQRIGREASWAGAGMLPPGGTTDIKTPEARLRSLSSALWAELSQELLDCTGIDNGYRRCGAINVCTDDNRDSFFDQIAEWQAEGIEVMLSDRAELSQHIPDLHSDFQTGAFLPDFCQVRNPRHVKALASACLQRGVQIVEDAEQLTLHADAGRVTASTPTRRFPADRICVTAGSWTAPLLQALNVSLPVQPVRGQIAQLQVSRLPFSCVIELGRRYLVPRPDGLILVGSTEEHVGFEKRNTTEGVAGLLKFAESLVPGLSQAEVLRCWAGLRPGSPDELPFLGRIPGFENLFVGAGHYRSGVQMSPGTAAVLSNLLLDAESPISLEGLESGRQIPPIYPK
ncbi:MAG: glycine oxidase ThiO [Planctomycetaceae bacterium]